MFNDKVKEKDNIHEQFIKLVETAKRKGSALAIGHPHPATIEVLSEVLEDTASYGVRFIGLKSLLNKRTRGERYAQGPRSTGTGL